MAETALVATLLLLHAWMALSATVGRTFTIDELLHITAGHACWSDSAVHLQPENGILPQRWVALPAVLGGVRPPSTDSPSWRQAQLMSLGYEYAYFGSSSPDMLLLGSRSMALVWSLATGLLIHAWTRRLFGPKGALFSLALFAFCPTFLANGPLANSDTCATFWLLASTGAFWRHLQRGTPGSLLLSVLCFGFACVSKFNAILLPAIWLPCFVVMRLRLKGETVKPECQDDGPSRRRLQHPALLAAAHVAGALLVIWALYGFQNRLPDTLAANQFPWSHFHERLGWKADLLERVAGWGVVPYQFVYGFSHVLARSESRGCFLCGECALTGWWYFFPLAFLFKSTLALIGLLMLQSVREIRQLLRTPREWLARMLKGSGHGVIPLLALLAVYSVASLRIHLNIGHRHILPVYAVLYILLGGTGAWLLSQAKAAGRIIAVAIPLAQAGESLASRPNYLAHFNPLCGGPAQGYRLLVDSSLDWGQDLPLLTDWLERNGWHQGRGFPCHLAYFGVGFTDFYVPGVRLLSTVPSISFKPITDRLEPGVYCISATMLQQPYQQPRDWTTMMEASYQRLRRARDAGGPESAELKDLRFRRLCAWLRTGEPDDQVGHSILIYRLSAEDLHRALDGPYSLWMQGRATRDAQP